MFQQQSAILRKLSNLFFHKLPYFNASTLAIASSKCHLFENIIRYVFLCCLPLAESVFCLLLLYSSYIYWCHVFALLVSAIWNIISLYDICCILMSVPKYTGQTGRTFNIRHNEYNHVNKNNSSNFEYSRHMLSIGHTNGTKRHTMNMTQKQTLKYLHMNDTYTPHMTDSSWTLRQIAAHIPLAKVSKRNRDTPVLSSERAPNR
jgi:hypothetical protein